jgi:uncharacterized protein
MPQFVPDETPTGPLLQGLSGGGFKVDGTVYPAVLLTTAQATAWDAPQATREALEPLVAARPELILLGTGAVARPDPPLTRALEAEGIGLEVMDSRAAARAWVILRGEGREVAAALMPLA